MRQLFMLLLFASIQTLSAQTIIKNITVIDVENKKLLTGYTVVAQNGKIISAANNKTFRLPEGAAVIDGTGKYLVPGFADAHVHFF